MFSSGNILERLVSLSVKWNKLSRGVDVTPGIIHSKPTRMMTWWCATLMERSVLKMPWKVIPKITVMSLNVPWIVTRSVIPTVSSALLLKKLNFAQQLEKIRYLRNSTRIPSLRGLWPGPIKWHINSSCYSPAACRKGITSWCFSQATRQECLRFDTKHHITPHSDNHNWPP